MRINNKQEVSRFMRFAVVGIIGAIVDFGIFNLLTSPAVGMKASLAQAVSFSCAVVSNFVWNRYWTYPDSRSKPITRQVVQFILVSVVGLVIRTPLFSFLETRLVMLFRQALPAGPISPVFAGHNASLAIAVVVVMFWNFLANRLWTYNDVDNRTASAA